jgi:hypothetical protein
VTAAGKLLQQALDLGEHGCPVFPLSARKTPHANSNGFRDATTDPDAIRKLFRRYRGTLIGVATGEVSGIDALDIDSTKHPAAGDWLRRWEPIETRRHRTRSGGSHLLFEHAAGLGSSQSYPAAGVDVRADGGYIVWWPCHGFEFADCPIIHWPDEVLAAVRKPAPAPPGPTAYPVRAISETYLRHVIANACRAVLEAPNGLQRFTLNREAYSLGTLVGAGGAPADIVRRALCETALRMRNHDESEPWHEYHIEHIVDDAIRDGMRRPRILGGRN